MGYIAHENLPELVTRELSEKIIRNELKPGERILEAKIAQELGVSRSPVREALRILEKNRLVEVIPRKGVRVTKITAQHIKWFYDIFEVLYGLAARRAAENAGPEDIDNMLVALEKIENAAEKGDIESYFINIFEYASVGMKAAQNPLLEQLIIELWPSSRRIQFSSLLFRADDLKKNVTYFQRCSKYVEQGNALMAEKVIQEYARNEEAFALKIANNKNQ